MERLERLEILNKLNTAVMNNTKFDFDGIMTNTVYRRLYRFAYAYHVEGRKFRLRDCKTQIQDPEGKPYSRYQLVVFLDKLTGYGILNRELHQNKYYYSLKDNFTKEHFANKVIEMEEQNEV